MNQNENSNKETSDEGILEVARKRFELAVEAEREGRALALEDLKFSAGEQWPDAIKHSREMDSRPCLTINRIPQFIRQITNDQRQNRPAIKVSPVDDKADVDTAKIFQGLIRHIEYASNADTAYDTAFDSAVRIGFGFFRIVTDYCDPMSFEQEIKIKRVPDRFSAYLDTHFQEPDGSDANWGTVFETISKEDFKTQYPDSKLSNMNDWLALGSRLPAWIEQDSVRIAEYFYKEYVPTKIYQLSTGETIEASQLEALGGLPEGITVKAERDSVIPKIKWVKHNGLEILEQTDWPGKWIPIIPVLGEEVVIEGKRMLSGVVRFAKDPQRMINYWKSAETETIALAPRAPFIGFEGQFEGHEAKWNTANVKNHAYLEAKPITIAGQPVPLPQRNVFEPPVQAITQASMFAADDLKATTGIYDSALGAQGNEKSGIAIQRRNIQAQTSNFHFIDNLSKSIRHAGRIIVDLIPHIYDTARAVRILGEDGSEEVVKINQIFEHKGEDKNYDMSAGTYDVSVDTGPSFETKRQEAVASMVDMSGKFPQLMQVAGDIMVKNMDWPGSQDIADRIRKTLDPKLIDDPNQKKNPIPPEVQQQIQQMQQMIDQLTQAANAAHDELDQKTRELESKERIEMMKIQANAEIELARLGSKESIVMLNHQIAQIQQRLSLLQMDQPIEIENESQEQGPDQAMNQANINQPTGGSSPGQITGV